jgi:hypothetical protein
MTDNDFIYEAVIFHQNKQGNKINEYVNSKDNR